MEEADIKKVDALEAQEQKRVRKYKLPKREGLVITSPKMFEAQHPKLTKKLLKQRAAGMTFEGVAKENGLTKMTAMKIVKRQKEAYKSIRSEMAEKLIYLADHARERTEELLELEDSSLRSATVMGIALSKVAELERADSGVIDNGELQIAAVNAATANIQAETIRILQKAGAFNKKVEPIDVTPKPENEQPRT